jgi:hypothetical protein
MEPAEVAVTESEAEVMDPEGMGWVLEELPPGELEEEDAEDEPQPGRREEAARASAP